MSISDWSADVCSSELQHDLSYLAPGCSELVLEVHQDTRLMLIGGPPFGESIVMWWNFVGRSHEEVVQFRSEWQDQITSNGELVANGQHVSDGRFGVVSNEPLAPLRAPPLPHHIHRKNVVAGTR